MAAGRTTVLACVDVDYRPDEAVAGCLVFRDWSDAEEVSRYVECTPGAAAYEPGRFYLRELPCLLGVLAKVAEPIAAVIVDGYAWLGEGRPGLGVHLHRALGGGVPVIGVAKSAFHGNPLARPVLRGASRRPLFVTAEGLDPDLAAERIRAMHGAFRIPTLLQRVDRLCREG